MSKMCRGHVNDDFVEITITQRIRVDKCLAPEILWLNDQGVRTVGSCCGHGEERGIILINSSDCLRARRLGYEPEDCLGRTDIKAIRPKFPQQNIIGGRYLLNAHTHD